MNRFLKSVLCILKNATVIIPLIEGVVYSIKALVNPELEECKDDEKTIC